MATFLEALHSGRVLLMDGAMGTELQRAGMQPGECYELWNVTHPERVRAIHEAYIEAGADVLLTNTFQANARNLIRRGLATHQIFDIWATAVPLARGAAARKVFVVASLGPGDWSWTGWDRPCFSYFGSADALLLETLDALRGVPLCLRAQSKARGSASLPVLGSVTFYRSPTGELQTFVEHTPEAIARQANAVAGLAALGVNCGRDISMDDCIEIIRRYRSVTDLPLFARPNAGTPTQQGGRWVYPQTPEQMAAKLPELLAAGVSMVGGCCGTTPAHIAAFRPIIDAWNEKAACGLAPRRC